MDRFHGTDILMAVRLLHLCCVLRVNGPIFPEDSSTGDATDSGFFTLEPSQLSNGCFVARLSRQVRAEGDARVRR